ncbi:isopeptide-forming domain-containing fimbrial protein [Anaerococcus sp. AGMB00486]|uniref:Isopeptide-forming domain-containing fimbrial protein n=1 Tax=Anaerococcus faecalis TaxID=2742993 RepID=A0ABX2N8Y7_9FIRM|nr:pilin N-terminal domain-containing protein [Anaerococcus faecalis]NVF11165.1 isopeptide-forming domain-containing fimbrial protein [Anaerococcus faecalis]
MKHKILSFLTALAMVLGIVVQPFAKANAAPSNATTTNTVTVHKILLTETALKNHDVNKKGYDGNKIPDIGTFFDAEAKEISGVYFKLQKLKADIQEDQVDVNNNDQWEDVNGQEGLTTEDGLKFTTTGFEGKYRIVEDLTKSTYKGEDGQSVLTGSKAVPTLLTLPLVNEDGIVADAHVYPKNTENKPEIDKNFAKENDLKVVEDGEAGSKVGAVYENYQKKKATVTAEIGKEVPYEVKTKIPANSKLKTAKWDDKMTSGLTFKKGSLLIKVGQDNLEKNTDYKLEETDEGFVASLTETGLKKVNEKTEAVEVTLTYTATVNSKSVVDIPEANDIMFHYGNKPGFGTTPYPTKPNENGELTINKSWDDGEWAEGETATFKLVDANTGEDVKESDLDKVDNYTFEGTVTIGSTSRDGIPGNPKNPPVYGKTYTWKGLKKDKQYKAVEIATTSGSESEFKKGADGTITVVNHRSDNPKPLNPTEPKVVNGGKKFVKTNNKSGDQQERLAGAEFYITNEDGSKYLVAAKTSPEAVKTAKDTLNQKVADYNNLSAEDQKGDKGTTAKAAIDKAQEDYNKAFKENANAYTWGEKADENVVVVTSDGQGRFEIQGLAYGKYKLEEKTAPKGYAARNDKPEFTVEKGSYAGVDSELQYNKDNKDAGYGKQIENKKVSIPQTGGIGSLIFVVAGIAIMGLAAYKIQANKKEA